MRSFSMDTNSEILGDAIVNATVQEISAQGELKRDLSVN